MRRPTAALNPFPEIPVQPPTRALGGWRPDGLQTLLLKASLGDAGSATPAFHRWIARASLRPLDVVSWRLLPLLGRNLDNHGETHPIREPIKPIHRYIWLRNTVHLNRARQALEFLAQQGIDTLALKGASLVPRYYRDPGLRPMEDFDLLIPQDKAWDTIQLLIENGWRKDFIQSRLDRDWVASHHSLNFVGPDDSRFDLHWHVFPECVNPDDDREFWNRAVPLEIGGVKTLALHPTDEFLAACLHGIRWEKTPPIRWIADTLTILDSGEAIDWGLLIDQAASLGQLLPLRIALTILRFEFDAAIPDETLRILNAHRPGSRETYELLRRIHSPNAATLFETLTLHRLRYQVCLAEWPEFAGPAGFCRYLQREWKLADWRAAPFVAAAKTLRRAGRTLRDLLSPPAPR